jgi:hypothetical protein
MGEARRSRLIVVDGDGKVAGVLSLADLAMISESLAAGALHQVAARESP